MSENKKVADRFVVSHFFDFDVYPESRWEVIFEDFAECGASSLTLRKRMQPFSEPVRWLGNKKNSCT